MNEFFIGSDEFNAFLNRGRDVHAVVNRAP